jgi:hypothetical protein
VHFGGNGLNGSGVYTLSRTAFAIQNLGNAALKVASITDNKSWLTILRAAPPEFYISAGESRDINLSVDWSQVPGSQDMATVTIASDDPDEPGVTLEVTATLGALPIQLNSFTGRIASKGSVILDWATMSETNNYGFEIQKSAAATNGFGTVSNGFVPGHGTTLQPQKYTYTDFSAVAITPYYRLKQIDLDGTPHYSESIRIAAWTDADETPMPIEYALAQNYPNPFNPSTAIRYQLPAVSFVTLKVYDNLGREVATLLNEVKQPGYYTVQWDASGVASGVYYYRLQTRPTEVGQARSFVETRKMAIVK